MRSDKQRETARRNGAKSRGPVTDTGKQRSAANAAKHHLTSSALLIPGETAEALDAHFSAYRDRFRPADPVELDLVNNLAFISWRQQRLWKREADLIRESMEHADELSQALFDDPEPQSASGAWKSLCSGPVIALLHRVEAGLRRAFDRTLKNLRELQASRPDPLPSPCNEKMQNEPGSRITPCLNNALQATGLSSPAAAGDTRTAPIRELAISLASDHNLLYKYSD